MKPTLVSLSHLAGMLAVTKGAKFATITALTDAKLLKTGNPFGKVNKRSRVNIVINFGYENAVNNQRGREGTARDFEAKPRTWGARIPGMPFVQHKGKLYLECKVERSLSHEYLTADGRTLTDDQVAPFQPSRHSNAEHQGVEKEIILRDYALEGIEEIAIDGERYKVDPTTIARDLDAIAIGLSA